MPPYMRRIFWFLNKFFMVPMMRLGFGPLFGNPFTGYIMVLKAIGRKTGKTRFAPVNYAIHRGNVYCISGGRESSDWYRNVRANPEIEVILPGGPIFGLIEEVTSLEERRVLIRQILKNAGFAGFFEGYNPFTISDEDLMQKSADLPLLRIKPTGIGSGASDAGGWAWVWLFVATTALILVFVLN
jgi:deazaflavin-dependent oxidoreductase (nitroreductase family)